MYMHAIIINFTRLENVCHTAGSIKNERISQRVIRPTRNSYSRTVAEDVGRGLDMHANVNCLAIVFSLWKGMLM